MDYMTMHGIKTFIAILALAATQADSNFPEVRDYCEQERFQPQCPGENQVVLVRYAKYGRMRASRCIGDTGITGCAADVRALLDSRCSGRRSCDVVVPSLVPLSRQPCDKTYRSYLEAAYTCVPVAYASPELCTGPLEVRAPLGYLSAAVAETTGCGALDSPWFVTVRPGQTVRLTLLDFTAGGGGGGEGVRQTAAGKACHVYAIIKEDARAQSKTVCAGAGGGAAVVYTSHGHMVEVRLVVRGGGGGGNTFLLKYEALGCADLPAPRGGWVRRLAGGDEAVVGCNATGQTYHVTCDGSTWRGAWRNCSLEEAGMISAVQSRWSIFSQYHGVSIFVIVCIAVAVGVIILTAGLVYLKRRGRNANRNHFPPAHTNADIAYNYRAKSAADYSTSEAPNMKLHFYGDHQQQQAAFLHDAAVGAVPRGAAEKRQYRAAAAAEAPYGLPSSGQMENDYYKTWQLTRHQGTGPGQPPLPPPPYSDSSMGSSGYNRALAEHIYESPKFVRKAEEPQDYYELDAEDITRVHT